MERRDSILEAAGELFATQGYGATTVEQIARRAGVGKEAFYRELESREACYLALFDAFAAEVERRLEGACAAEAQPWPDRVAAALRGLFDLAEERPAATRACLSEPLTAGPVAVERYELLLDRLASRLREGRRLNPRVADLPDSLERTLVGGIAWTVSQRLAAGEPLADLLPEAQRLAVRIPSL